MATQTKIDIKSAGGDVIISTPINEGARGYYSLMQHDYIVLPLKLKEPVDFKIGSYVDLRGVFDDALGGKLAKMYYVTESQNPTYNTSTGAYEYQLRLNAYYWLWNNFIFKYTPENTAGEASWSLTAPLDVQMGVFLRNLSELGFTYNGVPYEISIDSTVEDKAVAMTYDNTHLLDALFSMGGENAWNCDVWITENVIHFGRCEHGNAVKIEIGVEASDMTRNESKGTFATRIYAFGSTRNIPKNYRPDTNEDLTVNGIVQKRLMLPEDTPYIDAYPDMHPFEVVEAVVVFDDIYPKRIGTLSDVQTVDRAVTGDNGEQTGTFKAYQYKDSGITFDESYIIEGQELRIVFQSGKLNGLDFGVTFNPNNANPAEQLWEIVANEDYGRRLPDEVMKPENGDKYILYGFDIKLVSDQYIPQAEQELKERAEDYVNMTKVDDGTYTTTLRWNWVKADQINHTFDVGQRIDMRNKAFFGGSGRVSRVIGWEMALDIPYDNPIYTIGESAQYSRLNEIEDKVNSLTFNGQTYKDSGKGGGSGLGVYVITTNDSTPPSDTTVFSALRSLTTFLRKDKEDQTNFLVKFLGGIVTDLIESTDFVTGAFGAGFTLKKNADGSSYAELDKMLVRKKAYFNTLAILETELAGASFLFNSSGARIKITKVELVEQPVYLADGKAKYYADGKRAYAPPVYRCWFLNDDGDKTVENRFHVGNLARSQTFNIKAGVHEGVSNRYWWRLVVGVGDDYIDVSSVDYDSGSDIPAVDDVVVQLGDKEDPDYQAAIELSAFGDGAPYITFYQGINSYSTSGKDMFTVAYDRAARECYVRNYGRFYTGDREQTNYVKYSRKDGLEIRAKKIYLGAQDLESEISGLKSSIEVLPDSITSIVEDATSGLRSEIKQTTDEISLSVNGITTDMAGVKTEMNGMNEEITYISTNLKKTGIDIAAGQITVTAPNFRVQNNMGEAIAVFTHDESGNPVIKATNIDVDNLYVRKLDGAEGSIGSLTISTDSTEGYIPGILYEYDNTILKLQPRWISPMPYNVFNRQPSAEQMNVLFYLKRRRSESRDRALYIDGVAEVYGRLGVGRGPDTGYAANYPAFVAEGVAVYGQFCLSYKRVTSSITLDINTVFYIVIAYNVTLTLPTSGLYDGMVYYIMNYTYANTVKIKGKIQMTTSTDATAEVDLTTDSRLAILIYSSQTDTWYYSQI